MTIRYGNPTIQMLTPEVVALMVSNSNKRKLSIRLVMTPTY
ncbi:hypothetical protein [Escherichia coli]|nr:hypothetical protein [Escherichia coli]